MIFRVPGQLEKDGTPHYVTADEYLSGNVRRKLRQAQRAAQQDPVYAVNVEALTAAQPKDLDASEIEVRLGATWIDKEYIQQFMYETFNTPFYLQRSIEVNYSSFTAEWQIKGKSSVSYNDVAAYTTYGTSRANAYKILEDSLNLRDVRIYDTIEDADGKERRVLNAKETTLAAQKQQAIIVTTHIETVCQLVLRKPAVHINIDVDVEELVQDKRGAATYGQIKDYVLEHSDLKVSSLYIAQVKQKHGIIERENYNKPKSGDAKQPQCPPEKEVAIMEALRYYGMIK